jgi:hypothetical protein
MPSHVCTVVAAQHRQWWASAVSGLNELNVFVQPQNQGTAYGIALALLKLEMRNPGATVVILPADHYYRDEDVIARVLRIAGNLASANPRATYLMGAAPESPDAELGYILPAERLLDRPAAVLGFTEKPSAGIKPIDFSRDVLEVQATRLQVIRVSNCGWTDLGTPQRVEAAVRSMNAGIARRQNGLGAALFFDLCAQSPLDKSPAARL